MISASQEPESAGIATRRVAVGRPLSIVQQNTQAPHFHVRLSRDAGVGSVLG